MADSGTTPTTKQGLGISCTAVIILLILLLISAYLLYRFFFALPQETPAPDTITVPETADVIPAE